MNDMSHSRAGIEATLGVGKAGRKKTWRKRLWWIGGGVAALLVVGWLVSGLFGGEEGPGFQTGAAKRGPLSVKVTATGTLKPIDQVDVGAEVSGRVVTVDVDFNDRVVKDQILAQLDTSELEARRIQVEAQLLAAQASVREAEAAAADAARRYDRLAELAARARSASRTSTPRAPTATGPPRGSRSPRPRSSSRRPRSTSPRPTSPRP